MCSVERAPSWLVEHLRFGEARLETEHTELFSSPSDHKQCVEIRTIWFACCVEAVKKGMPFRLYESIVRPHVIVHISFVFRMRMLQQSSTSTQARPSRSTQVFA
jgi:hypothetical protein